MFKNCYNPLAFWTLAALQLVFCMGWLGVEYLPPKVIWFAGLWWGCGAGMLAEREELHLLSGPKK